jgi:hypothetical protein
MISINSTIDNSLIEKENLAHIGDLLESVIWWSVHSLVRLLDGSFKLVDVREKKAQQGCQGGRCACLTVQS